MEVGLRDWEVIRILKRENGREKRENRRDR